MAVAADLLECGKSVIAAREGNRLGREPDAVHVGRGARVRRRLRLSVHLVPNTLEIAPPSILNLAAVIAYIENNPAKAGLVTRREDWPFASAARRERT